MSAQAVVIKAAGNADMARALADGVMKVELIRLQNEIEDLRAEKKQLEEALGLMCWAREQENRRRLNEVREMCARRGLFDRLFGRRKRGAA